MSERHWVESLYETSAMRDAIGYCAPGGLFLCGILFELKKQQVLSHVTGHFPALILFALASYVTAIGLRLAGTLVPILVLHRSWGILGNPMGRSLCWFKYIERLLWRYGEDWLKASYRKDHAKGAGGAIERELVFLHASGIFGVGLLALGGVTLCETPGGLAAWLGVSRNVVTAMLFAASAVFLCGHYRHGFQIKLLQEAVAAGTVAAPGDSAPAAAGESTGTS